MSDNTAVMEIKTFEEGTLLEREASAFSVQSVEEFGKAEEMLVAIKRARKVVDDYFDPIIKGAHATHKALVAKKKEAEEPFINAEGMLKKKCTAFHIEQERLRKEEEARLRKAEEEARLQAAIKAEDEGKKDLAEEILAPTAVMPLPASNVPIPVPTNSSFKETWTFEVVDEALVPREYLMIDEVKIRRVIQAMKGQTNIPGIKVKAEKSMAVRR